LAIDTDQLARLIIEAINSNPKIYFRPEHKIVEITRKPDYFEVSTNGTESRKTIVSKQVVNATWENRIALDANMDVHHQPGWLYRLKYRVLAKVPRAYLDAPSATMVLGRYGDIVVRPDATAYLSWYPAGLRGWCSDLHPPRSWESACRGETTLEADDVVRSIYSGIEPWFPEIVNWKPFQVDAGAIVAYGRTDVHDRESGLHDRTHVGVICNDGYYSIDPGKLTTAPLFAMEAAKYIAADAKG
jgi:hypothetical protein